MLEDEEVSTVGQNNKRIAKNTMFLYFRMLLTMAVSLYTSRVVLQALGEDDFGTYNVVGGVVAMFSVLSGSLSASISRFITFELTKKDIGKLKKIFSTSVNIQLILSIIIVVLVEIVGVWFLNNQMKITPDRLEAANWILQFSLITFVVSLLSVPYNATIIAHEKMSAFAYIGIVEVSLKLFVAILINYNPFDRLIYYGLLILLISLIMQSIYVIYSERNFEEAKYKPVLDIELLKQMFGFAGWNFIGASSAILRDQGGNVIINLFYGTGVNAARGIAMQVNNAVSNFVTNFMTAVNPQITKSYASGEYDYMMKLVFQGARFSYYILLFLSLPIIVSTPYILNLWLDVVPEHTVNFVRLILIFSMSESLAHPLVTAMLATGKIRNYQLVVGGCQLLNLPLSYFFLRYGFPPEIVIVVSIVISVVCEMARLVMLRKMLRLPVRKFLIKVYFNVIIVTLIAAACPFFVSSYLQESFINFILLSLLSVLCVLLAIYFIGCDSQDKMILYDQLHKFRLKLLQR